MTERPAVSENCWLLIPYYSDPASVHFGQTVDKFRSFLESAKQVPGLNLAVVDDGCGFEPTRFTGIADCLIQISENRGKAYAVREGLKQLLANPTINLGFIIQYDGDGDQSYTDMPVIHTHLLDLAEGDPEKPALVIGDRYSEKLRVPPNPGSVTYRQTLLMFFGAIANQLGFNEVRDWVSGARGYTQAYAREFLRNSKSRRYGLESEQLVVASLVGARVITAPLTESRPRGPHTLTSKWLENFEVYLDYEEALRNQGKGYLVDLLISLVDHLKRGTDTFQLDLTPLGENTSMQFTRLGDRYTAEIPTEYRSRLFILENQFPFTIRK